VKKLLALFGPLVVLALALSGCGVSTSSSAASVNGSTIPISELNQTIKDASQSAPFRCLLSQQAGVQGAGVHATYSSHFVAQQLSLLVARTEINAEVHQLHLVTTALATQLSQSQITSGLNGQAGGSCTATGAQVFASLSSSYRSLLTVLQVDQNLLSAYLVGVPLTNAGVTAYSRAHPEIAQLACVSAILVAKRSQAVTVATKIKSGANFAALAKTVSIDTQSAASGGALGCVYPGEFASGLAKAVGSIALNTPSAPIAFGSNFVVLEVTQRQSGTAAGAALALVSSRTAAEAAFVNRLGAKIQVWVNSQYGRWILASGQYQIAPPSGPLNAQILNPLAVTPIGDTYN